MKAPILMHALFVALAASPGVSADDGKTDPEFQWVAGDTILGPGPEGSFDEVAVKDPSIVFFDGAWHLFYTARGRGEYTTGYTTAAKLSGLKKAPRHELPMIRGKERYGCAPQVLFFAPRKTWYLIYQNRDSNYQPMFSTTADLADPKSWSEPAPLVGKDSPRKRIDFWVICDDARAYLFYTAGHRDVMVRSTALESFPAGWGEAKAVLSGVHEAVHVYRVKDRPEFHMIYELNRGGTRSFGLATAPALSGPWTKVTDRYATGGQLTFPGRSGKWTEMVSHGEMIRSGYDQNLEYDPANCRWIIQGLLKEQQAGVPYPELPWKLGIMERGAE